MTALTKKHIFPRTRVTETACTPFCLSAVVAGFLLMMVPLLTGCSGGGSGEGGNARAAEEDTGAPPPPEDTGTPPPADTGITVSLEWTPVDDPSVSAYFVHYGRQSPGEPGSCAYDSSMPVDSPSATITNLDPDTVYYITVSAYNGAESACSDEVSTVTPPSV